MANIRRFIPSIFDPGTILGAYTLKFRRRAVVGGAALLLVDSLDVLLPLVVKIAIDSLSGQEVALSLGGCALLYVLIVMTQAVFRLIYRYNLSLMNVSIGDDLRRRYAAALFRAESEAVQKEKTGDLVSRLSSDIDTMSGMYDHGVITLLDAAFYLLTIPIILCFLSWELAIIAMLPLPLIPFLVRRGDRRIRSQFHAAQEELGAVVSVAQEASLGARILKSFVAEQSVVERYRSLGLNYIEKALRLGKTEAWFAPSLEAVTALSVILVLLVGGLWTIDGAISLGTFIAFQRYTQQLLWPMQAVGISIGMYQRSLASSDRVERLLKLPAESGGAKKGEPEAVDVPVVTLENVSYTHPGAQKPAIEGIHLTVQEGETIAIVGENGSGKSTLLALIPRLLLTSKGAIRLWGEDLREWDLPALRSRIGFATQDLFVLAASVRENIAFDPTLDVSPESLERASRTAALHEEIRGFPQGYETILGERGITLSGGQRQRLTLARALLRRAPLLILDDVFSSVDAATEARIIEELEAVRQTTIIVSHRLSSIRRADRIVVLSGGRIVQEGTHTELVSTDGWYRRFVHAQQLERELEEFRRGLHE